MLSIFLKKNLREKYANGEQKLGGKFHFYRYRCSHHETNRNNIDQINLGDLSLAIHQLLGQRSVVHRPQ